MDVIPNEIYIFDPSFSANLIDNVLLKPYVEHLKLEDKMFLLMPVNLLGNHWALLIYQVPTRKTYFLNSLAGNSYVGPAKAISNLFWLLIIEKEQLSSVEFIIPPVTQQSNSNDCGVYTVQFCLEFLNIFRNSILSDIGSLLSQPMFTSITDGVILNLRRDILRKPSLVEESVKASIQLKRVAFKNFIGNVVDDSTKQDPIVIADVVQVKAVVECEASLSELSSIDDNYIESDIEDIPVN